MAHLVSLLRLDSSQVAPSDGLDGYKEISYKYGRTVSVLESTREPNLRCSNRSEGKQHLQVKTKAKIGMCGPCTTVL